MSLRYKVGEKVILHDSVWFDIHEDKEDIKLGLCDNMRILFDGSTPRLIVQIHDEEEYELAGSEYSFDDSMINHHKTLDLKIKEIKENNENLSRHFIEQGRAYRSPDSGMILGGLGGLGEYQWGTAGSISDTRWMQSLEQLSTQLISTRYITFPEYAEKFTPHVDEKGILHFMDEENNTYTLTELFYKYNGR